MTSLPVSGFKVLTCCLLELENAVKFGLLEGIGQDPGQPHHFIALPLFSAVTFICVSLSYLCEAVTLYRDLLGISILYFKHVVYICFKYPHILCISVCVGGITHHVAIRFKSQVKA